METVVVGLIGVLILFFLLIVVRLPVATGLILIGFLGLFYLLSFRAALSNLSIIPFQIVSSYNFAVLPLFILMAEIILAADFGKDMFNLASKWLGRQKGGLAMATVGGSAIFGALTDSIATMLVMGASALPEMRKYKYNDKLSIGSIMAGACIGSLIPPSAMFIVYGILTGASIGSLFIAGIIPGLILVILDAIVITILCRVNIDYGPQGVVSTFKEKFTAFSGCGEIILLVILVLVGLTVGWFTPTECGAVGAFGAFIISFSRKRLSWQTLKTALSRTLLNTGMIYLLIIGALVFSGFMTVSKLPLWLSDTIHIIHLSPLSTMAFIVIIYFILGTVMDSPTMIMLTIPIFYPIVVNLGYDPVWFGVIVLLMCEIAELSPPAGLNLYVIKGVVPDVSIKTIWASSIPFLIAELALVILLLFFPQIALFLPDIISW